MYLTIVAPFYFVLGLLAVYRTESWSAFDAAVYPATAAVPSEFTTACMASCPIHITDIWNPIGNPVFRCRTAVSFKSVKSSLCRCRIGKFFSPTKEIYHYSDMYLTIVAPFYFVLGLLAVYRTSIQSMQNGKAPFAACLIELVMRIAATVGLSGIIGYTSVCIASPMAWIGACALLIPVYYKMMKGNCAALLRTE